MIFLQISTLISPKKEKAPKMGALTTVLQLTTSFTHKIFKSLIEQQQIKPDHHALIKLQAAYRHWLFESPF